MGLISEGLTAAIVKNRFLYMFVTLDSSLFK